MNSQRDLDQTLDDFFRMGSDEVADRVIDAALLTIDHTPQRRALRVPWRFPDMSSASKLAIVATAMAVVVGAAWMIWRAPGAGVGGRPAPTASVVPSVTPSAVASSVSPALSPSAPAIDTANWVTYESKRYGFNIGHPADWSVESSKRDWDLDIDASNWLSPAHEDFRAPEGDVRVSVWSVALEPGAIVDETWLEVEAWIKRYCEKMGSASCGVFLDGAVRLCVEIRDCHPGLLVGAAPPYDREVQAFFTGGGYTGQMVVVTVWRGETDPSVRRYGGARRLVEGFLSTMCVVLDDPRPTTFSCG